MIVKPLPKRVRKKIYQDTLERLKRSDMLIGLCGLLWIHPALEPYQDIPNLKLDHLLPEYAASHKYYTAKTQILYRSPNTPYYVTMGYWFAQQNRVVRMKVLERWIRKLS